MTDQERILIDRIVSSAVDISKPASGLGVIYIKLGSGDPVDVVLNLHGYEGRYDRHGNRSTSTTHYSIYMNGHHACVLVESGSEDAVAILSEIDRVIQDESVSLVQRALSGAKQ